MRPNPSTSANNAEPRGLWGWALRHGAALATCTVLSRTNLAGTVQKRAGSQSPLTRVGKHWGMAGPTPAIPQVLFSLRESYNSDSKWVTIWLVYFDTSSQTRNCTPPRGTTATGNPLASRHCPHNLQRHHGLQGAGPAGSKALGFEKGRSQDLGTSGKFCSEPGLSPLSQGCLLSTGSYPEGGNRVDTLCQLWRWGVGGGNRTAPIPPSCLKCDTPNAVTRGEAMLAPTIPEV